MDKTFGRSIGRRSVLMAIGAGVGAALLPVRLLAAGGKRIALVMTGSISDGGWNQLAYEGLNDLKGEGFETAYVENVTQARIPEVVRGYADDGVDLILGHGFEFGSAFTEIAPDYPDQKFFATTFKSDAQPISNLEFINLAYLEAAYAAGTLAALISEKKKAVGFVGSTPIAEYVYTRGCAAGKRVQCFGGAKNHMIIMPDADMDQTVDALIGAGYGSAGERCMAISVAVPVGAGTAERLLDKLVPRVESLKVGPSTDASADFGPVVTAAHMEKIKGYVDLGVAEGAKLLVDGRGFKMQGYENGFYVGGCLFDHVTPEMRIYKEEIFGPVLSIVRRDTYEDALEIVNAHEYGNGTAIFTQDGDAARDFAARVEVGMVGINVPIPVPLSYYTFGGWKRSSFGDLNQHGADGFRFWTKTKTVTSRWGSGIRSGADFVIPTMK